MWNLFNPLWWWNTIIDPFDELGLQKKEEVRTCNTVYQTVTANNIAWSAPVTVNEEKKPRKKKKAVKIGEDVYVKLDEPTPPVEVPKKPVVKKPRKK